jgi:hypothetical protein
MLAEYEAGTYQSSREKTPYTFGGGSTLPGIFAV